MAQNRLFMLEFAVQELVITIGNECAPPEYPLNAEFTFRTGVYVSIPEDDFGRVKDESELAASLCPQPKLKINQNKDKNGQCCLFALEKPVGQDENLMIHVYKKRTDKCKFLIGATEHKMKEMFDKVIEKFDIANIDENENGKNGGPNGKSARRSSGGLNGRSSMTPGGGANGNGKRLSGGQEPGEPGAEDAAPADAPAEDAPAPEAPADAEAPAEADGEEAGEGEEASVYYSAMKNDSKSKPLSETVDGKPNLSRVSNANRKSSAFFADEGRDASESSLTYKKIKPPKKDKPVSEVRKMGMPLYNLEGKVTGSMVLLIRLSCMGKTVTTSIPYPEQQVCGPKPVCDTTCRPQGSGVCADTCVARIQPCAMLAEDACGESETISNKIKHRFIWEIFDACSRL